MNMTKEKVCGLAQDLAISDPFHVVDFRLFRVWWRVMIFNTNQRAKRIFTIIFKVSTKWKINNFLRKCILLKIVYLKRTNSTLISFYNKFTTLISYLKKGKITLQLPLYLYLHLQITTHCNSDL